HEGADRDSFTGRFRTLRLVYLESFQDVRNAIAREKQIKGWTRAKKEALIASVNPHWKDLSAEWKDRFKPEAKTKSKT
ncbi:MAG TPA: GIY-YIG nuclease family protein, partial [Terriglobales bacterium]|nr:GIY-YIG nuclease family protein [Terriglobales bacterium]